MNLFDVVFMLIITIAVLWGFWRGLLLMIGGVVVVVLSALIASHASSIIGAGLGGANQGTSNVFHQVIFLLFFVVLNIVGNLLLGLVNVLTEIPLVGFLKHVGGALLGLLIGLIVVGTLTFIMANFPLWNGQKEQASQSQIVKISLNATAFMEPLLPKDWKEVITLVKQGK